MLNQREAISLRTDEFLKEISLQANLFKQPLPDISPEIVAEIGADGSVWRLVLFGRYEIWSARVDRGLWDQSNAHHENRE